MAGRLTLRERVLNALLWAAIRTLFRLDVRGTWRLPARGPGILAANHSTVVEGPLYYLLIRPRPATALAKREIWGNIVTRFIMNTWKTIPLTRARMDSRALRRAIAALDAGWYLGIAVEGTRSKDGVLQRGKPGVAMLAAMRNVPIYPVVHWGLTGFVGNLLHFRRTDVHIRYGAPLRLRDDLRHGELSVPQMRAITEELMVYLAQMLPPHLRGPYAGKERTQQFLVPV